MILVPQSSSVAQLINDTTQYCLMGVSPSQG